MKQYLNYINNFRGIAILFVISGHSIQILMPYLNINTYKFLSMLLENGTTLFVFISGFLFQHLSNNFETLTFYKKKFLNVVLPYMIISAYFIYELVFVEGFKMPNEILATILESIFNFSPNLSKIIYLFLTGGNHLGPLWFIPMICIIYLIAPLLIKLDRWKYFYYLIPLFLLITILEPRTPTDAFENFPHFFSIFIIGMYCSKYKNFVLNFLNQHNKLIIISIIILSALVYLDLITDYAYNPLGINPFLWTFQKLLIAFLLMYLLYKYDSIIKKKFSTLASLSFGLFFIHQILINYFKEFNYNIFHKLNDFWVALSIIPISIIVTLLCSLFLIAIKKLFKKYSVYLTGY